MSTSFLIVDGYNLMHEAGLARANYRPGELARQRRELLILLAKKLSVEERRRCTVVFDAIDAPTNAARQFQHEGMVVLFAEPGHEADEVIELLVSQHSAARRLTVVSSDHRLQTAIRRRRGLGLDSDLFLKRLEGSHRIDTVSQPSTSSATTPEAELGFWMQEFQDVSPETRKKEVVDQTGNPRNDWDTQVDQLQDRLRNPASIEEWLNESPKHPRPPKRDGG